MPASEQKANRVVSRLADMFHTAPWLTYLAVEPAGSGFCVVVGVRPSDISEVRRHFDLNLQDLEGVPVHLEAIDVADAF